MVLLRLAFMNIHTILNPRRILPGYWGWWPVQAEPSRWLAASYSGTMHVI